MSVLKIYAFLLSSLTLKSEVDFMAEYINYGTLILAGNFRSIELDPILIISNPAYSFNITIIQ